MEMKNSTGQVNKPENIEAVLSGKWCRQDSGHFLQICRVTRPGEMGVLRASDLPSFAPAQILGYCIKAEAGQDVMVDIISGQESKRYKISLTGNDEICMQPVGTGLATAAIRYHRY